MLGRAGTVLYCAGVLTPEIVSCAGAHFFAFAFQLRDCPCYGLCIVRVQSEVYVHVHVHVQVQVHVLVYMQLSVSPIKFLCDYIFFFTIFRSLNRMIFLRVLLASWRDFFYFFFFFIRFLHFFILTLPYWDFWV